MSSGGGSKAAAPVKNIKIKKVPRGASDMPMTAPGVFCNEDDNFDEPSVLSCLNADLLLAVNVKGLQTVIPRSTPYQGDRVAIRNDRSSRDGLNASPAHGAKCAPALFKIPIPFRYIANDKAPPNESFGCEIVVNLKPKVQVYEPEDIPGELPFSFKKGRRMMLNPYLVRKIIPCIDHPTTLAYACKFTVNRSSNYHKTYQCTMSSNEEEGDCYFYYDHQESNDRDTDHNIRIAAVSKTEQKSAKACLTSSEESQNFTIGQQIMSNTQSMLQHHKKTMQCSFYIRLKGPATNSRWGIPVGVGLRGGGETSLNTGTSGWGTPPAGNAAGWGGNPQGPQQGQWGANRSPGQPGSNQNQQGGTNNTASGGNSSASGNAAQSSAPAGSSGSGQNQSTSGGNSGPTSTGNGGSGTGGGSWAAAAGKGLPPQSSSTQSSGASGGATGGNGSAQGGQGQQPNSTSGQSQAGGSANASSTAASTNKQIEQLNSMREALFSQDGWGGQHVNQDTSWDTPGSPEPNKNDPSQTGTPLWKPNINNGTDLWEANLRNGGQPPAPPQNKTPWGHTPTTNIGGTWGEEDEPSDAANVWTGVPGASSGGPSASTAASGPWPGSGGSGGATGGPAWPPGAGAPANDMAKKPEWPPGGPGGPMPGNATAVGWGDPRAAAPGVPPGSGGPMDLGHGINRDMMPSINDMSLMGRMRGTTAGPETTAGAGGGGVMRGDPRGVSGRLTNTEQMWAAHQQPPSAAAAAAAAAAAVAAANKIPNALPQGGNQWGGLPKELGQMVGQPGTGKITGWEEPSPPAQRRLIPNFDDGTSLWGQQAQNRIQPAPGASKTLSHWKDIGPGNGLAQRGTMPPCPPGMPPGGRIPGAGGPGSIKPDGGPVWGQAVRNGAWDSHDSAGGWGEDNKSGGGSAGAAQWPGNADGSLTPTSWSQSAAAVAAATAAAGKGPVGNNAGVGKGPGGSGWGAPPGAEDGVDGAWGGGGHPGMQRGPAGGGMGAGAGNGMQQHIPKLSKEFIWSSKQFRSLCEFNFKKEDVEVALRNTNMSLGDAFEMLNQFYSKSNEGHGFDSSIMRPGFNAMNPLGFASGGPSLNAANPASGLLNNQALALGNMKLMQGSGTGAAGAVASGGAAGSAHPGAAGVGSVRPPSTASSGAVPGQQPTAQQLKMLVSQIQLAVQHGYLNQQILSQPLAPTTLMFLNQLLHNIRNLQNLQQQHQLLLKSGNNNNALVQLSLQIAKTKNAITSLQSNITTQQVQHIKQQQQQNNLMAQDPADLFRLADPLPSFPDLSITDRSVMSANQTQQSRLNQWKLPALDKDTDGSEFSRAPGSTKSHNLNPLLGQAGDATWSTSVSRPNSDGWPDTTGADLNSDKDSQWGTNAQQQANSYADIIPEFEPGKPWKGTQMKTVEDDPSMTPGSVARSPLSLATMKDSADLLSDGKNSPAGGNNAQQSGNSAGNQQVDGSLALSSSPWTGFNASSVYTSPLSKLTSSKSWSDVPQQQLSQPSAAEVWSAALSRSSGANSRGPPPGMGTKHNWATSDWSAGGGASIPRTTTPTSGGTGWGSTWLLLRNLTPQIDGSTLKTLCVQHGPLSNFHLSLPHGIALAKYSTREEATKANQALNGCVLSNTTILAENPSDTEVQLFLAQLNGTSQSAVAAAWNMRGQASKPPQPPTGGTTDSWAASATGGSGNLWPTNASGANLWGPDADGHRATPSSFLPPDLLNGESL